MTAACAVLVTMPHSHYAEKARWALDRLALPYREEAHVPLLMPALLPEACSASYPALAAVPAAMRDEVLRLRATVAGRFALRLYARERRRHGVAASGVESVPARSSWETTPQETA